jgi:hypothetical protein
LDNYPFFDLFSSIFSLFFHLHVFHCFMVFPFYDCLFFDLFILASYSSYPFFYTQKGRTDGACRGGSRKSRLLREPCIPPSRSRTRRSIQSQGSSRRRPHRVTDVAAPPSHKKKERRGMAAWERAIGKWRLEQMDGWMDACMQKGNHAVPGKRPGGLYRLLSSAAIRGAPAGASLSVNASVGLVTCTLMILYLSSHSTWDTKRVLDILVTWLNSLTTRF